MTPFSKTPWDACGIDMMPTFLELAGLNAVDSVEGQSMAPFLRGESDATCGGTTV